MHYIGGLEDIDLLPYKKYNGSGEVIGITKHCKRIPARIPTLNMSLHAILLRYLMTHR